jgi:hypothetical protein
VTARRIDDPGGRTWELVEVEHGSVGFLSSTDERAPSGGVTVRARSGSETFLLFVGEGWRDWPAAALIELIDAKRDRRRGTG